MHDPVKCGIAISWEGDEMDVLKVTGLYIAGVIGAGFASGQELVQFFANYGWIGLAGIGLSTLGLTLGCGYVLEYCSRQKIGSYGDLIGSMAVKAGWLLDMVYSVFLLVGVGVMLAGSGELFASTGWELAARYATALLAAILLVSGVDVILEMSSVLVPILLGTLLCICLRHLGVYGGKIPLTGSIQGVGASVLYSSYNLSFSVAVLTGVHEILNTKAKRWIMASVSNLILGLLMVVLVLAIWALPPEQQRDPVPLLNVARAWSGQAFRAYRIVLWASMYTTAVANSFALVKRLSNETNLSWSMAVILVLGAALISSHLGFVFLIRIAYPLLGIAGFYLFFAWWKADVRAE